MTSNAVQLWQACLQQLDTAATHAASPAAALKAAAAAVITLNKLAKLDSLPSATLKKLVKDVKVVQLLCKAFNDTTDKDPLSPASAAASFALAHFLTQAAVAGAMGSSHVGNAQQQGGSSSFQGSSSSSGRPHNSLAAEVRRQLQDSGLQQQLARTMEAAAQQLEADAADPAAPAAWWHADPLQTGSASVFSSKQTDALLAIAHTLMFHAPDDTSFWLQDAGAAATAAAHMSLSVLRFASAVLQQLAPPTGQQLTLLSGRRLDAERVTCVFGHVGAAWNVCIELQLQGGVFADADDQQHTSCTLTHIFELNIASTAAVVLHLQHACSQTPNTCGRAGRDSGGASSSSGGGGSNSSRRRSAAFSQQLATTRQSEAAADSTDTSSAWSQAHQQAASLTPLQQQLCSQLGVDARVLLWAVQPHPVELCALQSVTCLGIHNSILMRWSAAGKLCCAQQAIDGVQEQQQQQQQQQQQPQRPADAGQMQRELQLHLLLQCVTLPCCLQVLFVSSSSSSSSGSGSSSSNSDLSAVLGSELEHAADFLPLAMHSLSILHIDFAAAASSQAFPIHAWLEDVLQSLMLLSAQLHWGQQDMQHQHGLGEGASPVNWCNVAGAGSSKGSSSSSKGSSSSQPSSQTCSSSSAALDSSAAGLPNALAAHLAGTAATLCVMSGLVELSTCVCTDWSKAATAAAFAQWKGLGSFAAAADTACSLQPTYAAPLQHHTSAMLAQLDSCVRASHRCAAAGADTASTFLRVPAPLSNQAMTFSVQLLCEHSCWGPRPLFPLVAWAQRAGPGSKEQRQLYSLLASLLKLCGDRSVMRGDDGEQLDLSRRCRYGAAEAAGMLLLDDSASCSSSAAAAAAPSPPAAAEGTGAVDGEQPAPRAAMQKLLPSLVILGRACLQWAAELELQADTTFQQTAAGATAAAATAGATAEAAATTAAPLDDFSAFGICCGGLSPSTEHTDESTPYGSNSSSTSRLSFITEHFHVWLSKQHITPQLAAAGYDPHSLMQQLQLLKQAAAEAAAAAAAASSQQTPLMTQAVRPLVQQLQVVGAACNSLAVQAFCNNPRCTNISGATELQLVSGRSCICAGCRTARFCSRACLKQHWKVHKPVCQALAAVAAPAAMTSNAAAGVGGG